MPFWVGSTGNITDAANHWAAISGGAPGAGNLPTSATDAIFDANSGANAVITVDGAFSCLNFDMSACAATPTLAGSAALNVFGNFALKAGMTRTYTGALSFSATAIGKTVTMNGIALAGNANFNGVGGAWQLQDNFSTGVNTINWSQGALDLNGKTVTCGPWSASSAGALTAAGSTINCTTNSNSGFAGGGKTYGTVTYTNTGAAAAAITGANTFATALSLANTAVKNAQFLLSANQSCAAFNCNGNSAVNRILIKSSVGGVQRTITVTGGVAPTLTNTNFQDINGTGGPTQPWIGTSMGDALGNTGITFDAPVTQTATGTASLTWSTHGWTTRVPLPQDDVIIPNAFVAGRTITNDMTIMGKNITFSCTGSPIFANGLSSICLGSFAFAAGMTTNTAQRLTFGGRGTHTITSAGVSWAGSPSFDAPGGTYSFQDALTSTDAVNVTSHVSGTINTNGFTITLGVRYQMNSGGGTSPILNLGASTIDIQGTNGTPFLVQAGTINPGTSTVKIAAAATSRAVSLLSANTPLNNLWYYGAGVGAVQLSGTFTYTGQIKLDAGLTLQMQAGTTTTAADFQFGLGCTITSITAATHTLAKTGGGRVQVNAATISFSIASPANTFYDVNGTNGGNNTNWIFGAYIEAQAGAVAISGQAAGLRANRKITAQAGAIDISRKEATLTVIRNPAGHLGKLRPRQNSPRRPAQ
jgi:hypothetical protein